MRYFAIGFHPFFWLWRPRFDSIGAARNVAWLCFDISWWRP